MKLRILSDLHIEGDLSFRPKVLENEHDTVLVLAGDICQINMESILYDFIKDMSARFHSVVYVPGNHEYYRGNISNALQNLKTLLSEFNNVHILNNESIKLGGYNFIGSTMWTNFDGRNSDAMRYASYSMNDFRLIFDGKNLFTPEASVEQFIQSIDYIKHECENNERNIVITHHAPSYGSLHPQYRQNPLNAAFMSSLDNTIKHLNPVLWVHGHVHNSFDYMVGDTRIVCNPRGYLNPQFKQNLGYGKYENAEFNESLIIEY